MGALMAFDITIILYGITKFMWSKVKWEVASGAMKTKNRPP